jgi:hypothetical protein
MLSAGTSIGGVSADADIDQVTAGTNVGGVSADGNITTISAGQSVASVTADGWIASVSAGLDIGAVQAGSYIGGAVNPTGDPSFWQYANYGNGISAGRDVGSVTAGASITNVSAGRNILGSVTSTNGSIGLVSAGGGGYTTPSTDGMEAPGHPIHPDRFLSL